MRPDEETDESLERRLEKLENQLDWMRRSMMGTVAVAIVLILAATSTDQFVENKVIRAQRFELVNDEGTQRGIWGISKGVPSFSMKDETGSLRVGIMADKTRPTLTFFDKRATSDGFLNLVTLGVSDGGPSLSMWDRKGKKKITIGATENVSSLFTHDNEGNMRVGLIGSSKSSGLVFYDEKSTPNGVLRLGKEGKHLQFWGRNEKLLWESP